MFQRMKRKAAVPAFSAVLTLYFLATCLGLATPAQASGATVYVEPARSTVVLFTTFDVNVSIANVTESVYSYLVVLCYNSSVLEGVDIWVPEDHFLKPINPSFIFFVAKQINHTGGYAEVAVSLLADETGKMGYGTLYTVSFRAKKPANTLLAISRESFFNDGMDWPPTYSIDILDSVVEVVLPDFDKDGKVTILDLSMVAQAFGSVSGDERWNTNCDVNRDDRINMLDVAVTGKAYGMTNNLTVPK